MSVVQQVSQVKHAEGVPQWHDEYSSIIAELKKLLGEEGFHDYMYVLFKWTNAKITKEETEKAVVKLLSVENLHLHNQISALVHTGMCQRYADLADKPNPHPPPVLDNYRNTTVFDFLRKRATPDKRPPDKEPPKKKPRRHPQPFPPLHNLPAPPLPVEIIPAPPPPPAPTVQRPVGFECGDYVTPEVEFGLQQTGDNHNSLNDYDLPLAAAVHFRAQYAAGYDSLAVDQEFSTAAVKASEALVRGLLESMILMKRSAKVCSQYGDVCAGNASRRITTEDLKRACHGDTKCLPAGFESIITKSLASSNRHADTTAKFIPVGPLHIPADPERLQERPRAIAA